MRKINMKIRSSDEIVPSSPGSTAGGDGSATMRGKKCPIFLRKTYDMITTCDPNLATWSDDGKSFVVKDPDTFASTIIPQYFKHNNFSSFVRQLNFYGFRKIKLDPIKIIGNLSSIMTEENQYWRFKHERFVRDRPELLFKIRKGGHTYGPDDNDFLEIKLHMHSLESEVSSLKQDLADLKNMILDQQQELLAVKKKQRSQEGMDDGQRNCTFQSPQKRKKHFFLNKIFNQEQNDPHDKGYGTSTNDSSTKRHKAADSILVKKKSERASNTHPSSLSATQYKYQGSTVDLSSIARDNVIVNPLPCKVNGGFTELNCMSLPPGGLPGSDDSALAPLIPSSTFRTNMGEGRRQATPSSTEAGSSRTSSAGGEHVPTGNGHYGFVASVNVQPPFTLDAPNSFIHHQVMELNNRPASEGQKSTTLSRTSSAVIQDCGTDFVLRHMLEEELNNNSSHYMLSLSRTNSMSATNMDEKNSSNQHLLECQQMKNEQEQPTTNMSSNWTTDDSESLLLLDF